MGKVRRSCEQDFVLLPLLVCTIIVLGTKTAISVLDVGRMYSLPVVKLAEKCRKCRPHSDKHHMNDKHIILVILISNVTAASDDHQSWIQQHVDYFVVFLSRQ